MSTWSFYDSATGLFSGRRFSGSPRRLESNTPAGFVAIEGEYDPLAQRVDLAASAVVPYSPPPDHPTLVQRRQQRAREAIARAESAQARVVREYLLTLDLPPDVRARLEQIESIIVAARGDLT